MVSYYHLPPTWREVLAPAEYAGAEFSWEQLIGYDLPKADSADLAHLLWELGESRSRTPEVVDTMCALLHPLNARNPFAYLDGYLCASLQRVGVRKVSRLAANATDGSPLRFNSTIVPTLNSLGVRGTRNQWDTLRRTFDTDMGSVEEALNIMASLEPGDDVLLASPPEDTYRPIDSDQVYEPGFMSQHSARTLLSEEDPRSWILDGLTGSVLEFAEDLADESLHLPRFALVALATRRAAMDNPYRMFDVCNHFRLYTDVTPEALSQMLELSDGAMVALTTSGTRHLASALADV